MKKIIIILLFITIGCNEKEKNYTNNNTKNKIDIKIIDSIKLNGNSNLVFDNYDYNKILTHNPINNTLYIYDLKKNKTLQFNKMGNNHDNYRFILFNTVFYNDSTIMVGLVNKLLFYNLNGRFLFSKKIKRKAQTYYQIENPIFINDSILVLNEGINGDLEKREYYQQKEKLLSIYNINSGKITRRFANFPEKNSAYNDEKYYYQYPTTFSINKSSNSIYLLGYNDPNIYMYNLNGKLENTYKLNLKYYTPHKRKFGDNNNTIEKIKLDIKQNSEIYNFDLNDSLFFVAYNKAFDKDDAIKALANDEEKRNCLHIRNRSGKILYDDILPEYLGKFMFEENDTLYFLGKTTEKSENENYSTLYMAKLIENK